jgi:glycerate 2-kinase
MPPKPATFLQAIFEAALARVDPRALGPFPLPTPSKGKTIVIGAGKAAAAFAQAIEAQMKSELRRIHKGLAVCPKGTGLPTDQIKLMQSSHPTPDQKSAEAAVQILALASDLTKEDQVIVLLSGGGSSLLSLPAQGLDFDEKIEINKALLKSGAPIEDINCVRKHISAIKGGRLAKAAFPATVTTFAISDVVGDDPAVIASGPTVPDPTSQGEALEILARYKIPFSKEVRTFLEDPQNETPKPGDPAFKRSNYHIVANPADAFNVAEAKARHLWPDLEIHALGSKIEGDVRAVAGDHAKRAMDLRAKGGNHLILSGGELTVRLPWNTDFSRSKGGPNHEYVLAVFSAIDDPSGITVLAADTDGKDGSTQAAGAIVTQSLWDEAMKCDPSPQDALLNHTSGDFLTGLGACLVTGPTHTNVNDFRAILIQGKQPGSN